MLDLQKVIMDGEVEKMHAILEEDFNLFWKKDDSKRSFLHIAARFGKIEFICYLVFEQGMFGNETDIYGNTPLHDAAMKNHVDVARLLLIKSPELVNTVNKESNTPLHIAAKFRSVKMIKYLLENTVTNSRIRNSKGLLPEEMTLNVPIKELITDNRRKNGQNTRSDKISRNDRNND